MLYADPTRRRDTAHAPSEWRSLLLPWAMSLAAHLLVLGALLWLMAERPVSDQASYIRADLVEMMERAPAGMPDAAQLKPSPQRVSPQHDSVQPKPRAAAPVPERAAVTAPTSNMADVLSEAELAGIMSAHGDGGDAAAGGGGCDIVRAVEHALQRDPAVHTAVANADRQGKVVMLWNGDWVRSGDQDGKGLSVVREAVMWEVAFAPEACRNMRMQGPVLLSLADGTTRFVIGAGAWRWSDLLGLRGGVNR
jgi:hypothetical protein